MGSGSSWSQDISTFLSSPLGTQVSKILTFVAVAFIVFGCLHAVFKHHQQGLGKVIRRCGEVLILGIILATPLIWGNLLTWIAGLLQDIVQTITSL